MSSDSYTSITTKTDALADLTAYRTLHAMTSSTVTHTVETGRNYLITFTGDDDSTDISTGLFVYRPLVSVEIGSLRPSDMAVTAIKLSPEYPAPGKSSISRPSVHPDEHGPAVLSSLRRRPRHWRRWRPTRPTVRRSRTFASRLKGNGQGEFTPDVPGQYNRRSSVRSLPTTSSRPMAARFHRTSTHPTRTWGGVRPRRTTRKDVCGR